MEKGTKTWNAFGKAMIALVAVAAAATSATASSGGQGAYLSELWSEAKARGIPRSLFDEAFAEFQINPRVMELTKTQPETVSTVQEYLEKRVTPRRLEAGGLKLTEWSQPLANIEEAYGVPAEVTVAIWGIETNYGGYVGTSNVVHALATLAHEGYRGKYFRGELMTALEIARDGHVRPNQMVGSWAGAMGQTQFMPSSFTAFAVDFEGDGRADIWNSIPDALASSANYLKKGGWRRDEAWGYEVSLPVGFDYAKAWPAGRPTLRDWQQLGVKRADGKRFARPNDLARLYLPAGGMGPAFLLLRNFEVIKKYNNSDSYALAVAHLADRLSGRPPFIASWPGDATPLTRTERQELQTLLAERGLYSGKIDGRIERQTRLAIIGYQRQQKLYADAFPTKQLLQLLRGQPQSAAVTE